MLTVDHISVMNLENAMRGARNPLNSWARSDSYYDEQGNFYTVDPTDYSYQKVASKTTSYSMKDLSYDYSTGYLYGLAQDANSGATDLVTVDTMDGQVTKVGTLVDSYNEPACAFAVDNDGLVYFVTQGYGFLCTYDVDTQTTENLAELRNQIDQLDNQLLELLAKRMRVSREIGQYKKEHSMPVLQTSRYDEILQKRMAQAVELGMGAEFMKEVMQAIHEESVHQQMEIINQ